VTLKERARALKAELLALHYACGDPRTPWLPKAIIILALAYSLSPIDLIPDFIPVLGMLDDLLIVPGMIALAIRLLPPDVLEGCRKRAREEPFRLGKNWFMAICFILVWIALAVAAVWGAVKLFSRKG
jgi:uncharacterized membrane protein YkvA (DUF1232 family)